MDQKNERQVWEMLLKTASDFSAQYLYFVPKMPKNLPFTSKVSVAVCFNGASKKRHPNVDLNTSIHEEVLKRRKLGK